MARAGEDGSYEGWRVGALGLMAFLMLAPVTLPVTVLRPFVQERFGVSELLTSLFMAINMIGAVLSAPLVGVLADRIGRRRTLIVAALALDSVCLYALTLPVSFGTFLGIRLIEGCAHIAALSMLMTLAAGCRPASERGRVMGLVGGGITLGVAVGAPLGGFLGRDDPMQPLLVGSALVAGAAIVGWLVLFDTRRDEARPSLARIVSALRANRDLLAPLAFAFADRFTVGFFTTTFSLYLTRIHDLTPPRIGILITLFMIPFAGLSYPFGRFAERHSRVAMLCVGSLLYGVGTASLGFWPMAGLPWLMVALGICSAVMFVPTLILTADLAPADIRTTALGAFNAAGSLGFIAGPLVGGFVSESMAAVTSWETGYRAAFAVAGASEILCVLLALPILMRLVRAGLTR
jgi:MFS family permease